MQALCFEFGSKFGEGRFVVVRCDAMRCDGIVVDTVQNVTRKQMEIFTAESEKTKATNLLLSSLIVHKEYHVFQAIPVRMGE